MKPPPGMSEVEKPPPTSPQWSRWMKPPPGVGRRSGAATVRASYLLHVQGRRSDAAARTADVLDA
jgi:hypothetical protein